MKKILVLIDHAKEKIHSSSWDALSLGIQLGSKYGYEVHAFILGSLRGPAIDKLANCRLASLRMVDDPALSTYDPDLYCETVKQVLAQEDPQILLMGQTYQAIDLAPKLSAVLRKPLLTDCIGYSDEKGYPVFVRQMFRNRVNAKVRMPDDHPWLLTVQAGAFAGTDLPKGSSEVEYLEVDLGAVTPRRRTLEMIEASPGAVDLSKAEIIIGVGRGIRSEENLTLVRDLADALQAEIGASRPVVDNDWLERARQIGSSGQSVSPKLYVACGISGAVQHLVGLKGSGCTVAINTDPNAPIFNVSDYGIVGDLLEVIPAFTKLLKKEME